MKAPARWLIVLTGLEAGLRLGEILNLRVHQVNMRDNYILLEGTGAKSGVSRRVPLSGRLRAHFAARPALIPADFVWSNPDTRRAYRGAKYWWPATVSEAKRGGRLQTFQHLLGHGSMAMTERYGRLGEGDAEQEFRRLYVAIN